MKCRTVNCDNYTMPSHPAEKQGLCVRCWEEMTALEEMRKEKERKKHKGPPIDCLPVHA